MELGGKKYEILPGTAVPNMKDILAAASDFSTPGVENLQIKGEHINSNGGKSYSLDDVINDLHTMNEEDLKKLQALGDEVSESEARAQEESRRKMEAIMNNAVIAPESLSQLRDRAASEVSEEKKAEIEKLRQEQEAKEAEERAKAKAREERRQMQRQAMLDSRAKAEEEAQNAGIPDSVEDAENSSATTESAESTVAEPEVSENVDASNVVDESVDLEVSEDTNTASTAPENTDTSVDTPTAASDSNDTDSSSNDGDDILSSDDTLDDFSEFL